MKINEIKTDKILSPTSITLADYVINPYRGCEFGCVYCYSMNNKNMDNRREEWGSFVDVKVNSLKQLEKELGRVNIENIRVLLGSVTEVFQPVEKKFLMVKGILNILKERNISCTILTKSFLIAEYLDLLTYSPDNIIYITLNSPCVRQLFEGDTPAMSTRLKVMKRIIQKGIQLCVYISPFFPSLTDHNSIMKDLQELTAGRFSLYFENYNIKMGNWREIKKRLPEKLLHEYASIFGNIDNYKEYWKKIRKEIMAENKKYGYAIKFFIYPYDDYYRNEF